MPELTAATKINNASHADVTSVTQRSKVHDESSVTGRFRHTSWYREWSSDVCSSDLTGTSVGSGTVTLDASGVAHPSASQGPLSAGSYSFIAHYNGDPNYTEIGRASCRERV